jgi:hypothetical protein
MTPNDDIPWGDTTLVVLHSERMIGRDRAGRIYYLDYDTSEFNPGGQVCNAMQSDGTVCRLPGGHFDVDGTPHMPFHIDVLTETGIYVSTMAPVVPDDVDVPPDPGTVSA